MTKMKKLSSLLKNQVNRIRIKIQFLKKINYLTIKSEMI